MPKFTEITVSKGATINLGNYESQRVEVSLTAQIGEDEKWDEAAAEVAGSLHAIFTAEVDAVLVKMPEHQAQTWRDRLEFDEDDDEFDTRQLDPVVG